MSLTRQVTVWCDRCAQWEQISGTAKQLRKDLQHKGWTREGVKDYCPPCSKFREESEVYLESV